MKSGRIPSWDGVFFLLLSSGIEGIGRSYLFRDGTSDLTCFTWCNQLYMSLPLLTMHIINTRRFCPLTSLTSYLPSTSLSHLFLSATCIFRSPIQPHLSPLRACLRPLHVTCATISPFSCDTELVVWTHGPYSEAHPPLWKTQFVTGSWLIWSRISMITLFISAVDWTENTSNPPPPTENSAEPQT